MAAKVSDIIQAHCSQCRANNDAEVVAVVGDEIVTVTCKTCGTSQRYRPPMDPRSRSGTRRIVDVSGSSSPRPRGRSRRVISSTGREIINDLPPRPRHLPSSAQSARAKAKTLPASPPPSAKDRDLRKQWDALTAGVLSRHGRPHRKHESYSVDEVILHTAFGMGVIREIADDGTLTVLFKDGYQKLPSRPKDAEPAPA